MKIEIGESVVLSWMRHVLGCQIVQMNWKPSSSGWEVHDAAGLADFVAELREHFFSKHGHGVFNKGSVAQLMRQGEVDVLGLKRTLEGPLTLYAADVAFHENGLKYGSRDKTIGRVLKKLIRTAITMHGYFPGVPAEIIFATPVADTAALRVLAPLVDELDECLGRRFPGLKARLICNERFRDQIVQEVVARSGEVADTSELLLRSVQMLRAVGLNQPTAVKPRTWPITKGGPQVPHTHEEHPPGAGWRIGDYVQERFWALAAAGQIPPGEVARLVNKEKCGKIFGIALPLLEWLGDSEKAAKAKRGSQPNKVKVRYWATPIKVGDQYYMVCSQWWKQDREDLKRRFDAWAATLPPAPQPSQPLGSGTL